MSVWTKLRALLSSSRREAELEEELAFHLDEEADECQAAGLSSKEAHYAARRDLGNLTRLKEETRANWTFALIETTLQDLRVAGRSLRKNPGFGAAAILILGLGIGASTAVFSVVNAVVLKPLAFRDPDRIVALSSLWKQDGHHGQVSIPDFDDLRAQSASFESMAYYTTSETTVTVDADAQFTNTAGVSPEFFRVLGVDPALGRFFQANERAVVVSHAFWESRLGGDVSALGKPIRFGRFTLPVVAVMPAAFRFPDKTEVWFPLGTIVPIVNPNRGAHNYLAVGRLKTNVDLAAAQSELTLIGNRLEQQFQGTNRDKNVAVSPLREELQEQTMHGLTTMLYLLLGAVLLLLLISCGNVANLLLAKAATRTREMGVRTALGAARSRIIRQLTTESLALGIASGVAGLTIAKFGTQALVAFAPANIPRLDEASLDGTVLAFAVGLTLAACLLFGVIPAMRATQMDVNRALKAGGGRGLEGIGSTLRRVLVVVEVAVSVILLTGAGLLIHSFFQLSGVPLGFETRQVLVMETNNPTADLEVARQVVRRYQTLLEQAAAIPGIVAVGAARVPPGRVTSDGAYEVDGAASAGQLSTKSPQAVYSVVSPGAFAVLGIPVRRGRDFSAADAPNAPLTAIINETLARRTFPNTDPIGHTILTGMDIPQPMTIVGVVGDIRQRGPAGEAQPEVYMPYQQHPLPSTGMRILVRTSVAIESVMQPLRELAKGLAPQMPVRFTTMDARIASNVAAPRFRTLLLAIFAGLAVALSIAGVYSVVSFLVNQSTREIGVRMALGARGGQVMQMVLMQGVRLAAIGLAVGLAGALASARFLESLLFEVQPTDPITYAAVAGLVAIVAVVACLIPARRASKIDPMVALRQE